MEQFYIGESIRLNCSDNSQDIKLFEITAVSFGYYRVPSYSEALTII